MLLDLFKQKKQDPAAAAEQPQAKPLPIPAAAAQPIASQQKPAVQSSGPQPAAASPVASIPPVQTPTLPNPAQQAAPAIKPNLDVDDIYPLLLRKIKDEFKDVAGEAEKLKEIDIKMTQVMKQFTDFKKFVDDSKANLEELRGKTEKFDVALYELLTNQFNPFIKKDIPSEHAVTQVENQVPPQVSQQVTHPSEPAKPAYAPPRVDAPLQQQPPQSAPPAQRMSESEKESLAEDYEHELRKIMEKTKSDLLQEAKTTMVLPKEPEFAPQKSVIQETKSKPVPAQKIVIEDALSENKEPVFIPAQDKIHEEQFLEGVKKLTPGVKQMEHSKEYIDNDPNRTVVKEKIVVEDVLSIPKEGSDNHEVSETLSFQETWNDPDAQDLSKTPPKLKRFDVKDLLSKFMSKHDDHEKKLEEYVQPQPEQPNIPPQVPYIYNKTVEPSSSEHSLEDLEFLGEKQRISQIDIKDPKKYFWFRNGKVAKNIPELVMALTESDEGTFSFHVTPERNDLANWIRGVFNSEIVAKKVAACKTKDDTVRLLY